MEEISLVLLYTYLCPQQQSMTIQFQGIKEILLEQRVRLLMFNAMLQIPQVALLPTSRTTMIIMVISLEALDISPETHGQMLHKFTMLQNQE